LRLSVDIKVFSWRPASGRFAVILAATGFVCRDTWGYLVALQDDMQERKHKPVCNNMADCVAVAHIVNYVASYYCRDCRKNDSSSRVGHLRDKKAALEKHNCLSTVQRQ
jgi:hypothetical protein